MAKPDKADVITVEKVEKGWKVLTLLFGLLISIGISAFGWGIAWNSFQNRVDVVEARVVKLESREDRITSLERTFAGLTCKLVGNDDSLCKEAINNVGGRYGGH